MKRENISSGTAWEDIVGYSRAVKAGNLVFVAGTTAVDENGKTVGINDPYAQAKFALKKIEKALQDAGASMQNVVRTRMFVTDISRWKEFGRAHGQIFKHIKPVATMVEVKSLIHPELMIEIEADAVLEANNPTSPGHN